MSEHKGRPTTQTARGFQILAKSPTHQHLAESRPNIERRLEAHRMRPPLFVLLLNLPTLPLAASEVSAQAEHAMVRYRNHLEEFSKTGSLDNYKMACLELRMASTRLNNKLNKLQANSSSHRSFLVKDKIMNTLAGGCKPYGL